MVKFAVALYSRGSADGGGSAVAMAQLAMGRKAVGKGSLRVGADEATVTVTIDGQPETVTSSSRE